MSTSSSFLSLPTEIRLRIYTFYFSSLVLRPCYNGQCINLKGSSPPQSTSPNSLILVCKQIQRESTLLVIPHALFWVDSFSALLCMVRHHIPAQLQSIRHFAISTSLVPLPGPNPRLVAEGVAFGTMCTPVTMREELYRAFYEQVCGGLQNLVLFNPVDARTRRRILEQQTVKVLTEAESDEMHLDAMRLKADLCVPVLRKHLLGSGEGLPFRIMLRYKGSDGEHRVGVYTPGKGSQRPAVPVEADDSGI